MRAWNLSSSYRKPKGLDAWTAGLIGGVLGILLMGALRYLKTRSTAGPRAPKQLDLGRHGQAPDRSHIQLFSHPARQS